MNKALQNNNGFQTTVVCVGRKKWAEAFVLNKFDLYLNIDIILWTILFERSIFFLGKRT
jgi:hypothetical protein